MKEYAKNAAKDFGSGAMDMLRLLVSPAAVAIMWFVGLSIWMASTDRVGFLIVVGFYCIAFTIYIIIAAVNRTYDPRKWN